MKTKGKKIGLILLVAIIVLAGSGIAFAKLSDKKDEKENADNNSKIDMSTYAKSIDEIKIPENARIIGIGEATHGNVEFQMLKLTVLQKMVAEGKCRSIAFEMPASDGASLNACAMDKNISVEETVKNLMYPLYSTREMVELVTWIRDYNQNVAANEQIRIYGIDMQGAEDNAVWIATNLEATVLEQLTQQEKSRLQIIAKWDTTSEEAILEEADKGLFEKILSMVQSGEDLQLTFNCQILLQAFDAPSFSEDANAYGEYRDNCMALNTQLVEQIENKRGFAQVVLTGHNGHLMKGNALSYGEKPLGQRLSEYYGEDYFVIGTEFYHADVNIHTAGTFGDDYERKNHYFCSEDPIAEQAQYQEDGMFYLDFSVVTDTNCELYQLIHQECNMGLVGEGYSEWMMASKSYLMKVVPAERYDAVIYVYQATPIDPM